MKSASRCILRQQSLDCACVISRPPFQRQACELPQLGQFAFSYEISLSISRCANHGNILIEPLEPFEFPQISTLTSPPIEHIPTLRYPQWQIHRHKCRGQAQMRTEKDSRMFSADLLHILLEEGPDQPCIVRRFSRLKLCLLLASAGCFAKCKLLAASWANSERDLSCAL